MRRFVLIILVMALLCPAVLAAQDEGHLPEEWEKVAQSAPMTAEEFRQTSLQDWLDAGIDILQSAVRAPIKLLAEVTAVLILAALVRSVVPSDVSGGTASIIDLAASACIFILCVPALASVTEYSQKAFTDAAQYLTSFVPIFAGIVAACGQAGSAAVYSGLFFTAAMAVSHLFSSVGVPFLRMLLSLSAVACVDSGVDVDSLAKQLAVWVKRGLAVGAAVFTALLGMQGILAQSADSLALKTGKLIVSSSIPVVGKAMSDALGTVLAGLHLMKATVGFAVVAVTAASFIPVLTQCAVYQAAFAVARALAAGLGVRRAEKLLDGFSNCMGLCMAMCGLFGFMVLTSTILMVILGGG